MPPDFEDVMDKCRQIPRRLCRYPQKLLARIESTFKDHESSVVKYSLPLLRFQIEMYKGEFFLKRLLRLKSRNDERLMAHQKDQIKLFVQKFECIALILSDERIKDREDVLGAIGEFFHRLPYLPFFLNEQDEMTNPSFPELLDKETHLIKAKLMDLIPKFPKFNFPKTSRLKSLDFLGRKLRELLKYNSASTALAKLHTEEIQIHLQNVSQLDIEEHPKIEDLVDRFTELAYEAEYIIDSIEDDAQWQHFVWLDNVLDELRLLSEKAGGIHLTTPDMEVQDSKSVTQVSVDKLSTKNTSAIDEIVVDLSNREDEILNQLTRGPSKLDIVFVAGMPGLGKTTLARKVYSSRKVMRHFHLRAWCSVSQEYEKRRLLLEILTGIHGLTEEIRQMRDEDLQDKLRKLLLRNKYLVVMDDVWGIGAWNDLKNSFPDNANGSRILFTSRLHKVASEIKPDSPPLSLSLFSQEESWQLLEKKVFKEECCPNELVGVGKDIAYHCQGLPLAVVAAAGILKTTEKSQNSWKTIADNLSSQIIDNPEARCKEVLNLSYKHLPEYLKSCFLYLGVLNEDRDVLVSKLIRFWIAEGFIPETNKGSEEVAEAFLMDLIDRSLVIISKRRSNGKVRACRLHDLVLDFCKSQTEDENFFQLITRSDNPYASFPNTDYGFEFDFYHHSSPVSFASYRLAISLKRSHFIESKPSGLASRSLVFFASTDSEPKRPYDISFIWHNFKLLRVLDFECFNLGISFPVEIEILVQLRYLAVGGYLESIPQSIANLRKLKTLIVKGLSRKITLPNTIWRITSLRHLHVSVHVDFDSDAEELGDCSILENLISFSRPSLSCGEDAERIIKRIPNLCKLSCIFYESPDSSMNCNHFPRLNCLTHLESLKIFYYGSPLNNGEFILPLNLKKLTLSNFRLPWSHISTIGRLPNLEVLKLLSGAFVGKIWKVEEEFQNLKFLSLDNLNIAQWNASCDDFPKLERLVLQNCKDLEEIPAEFADIYTLEMIEVHWCSESAEKSAIKIREETADIKVLIRSSNLNS
ncbi:putative late blight resistance protein homolog R1A-3 [Coffea arabica]|uniref:Late blight resistance protein homolog R1A-3 n=1 Tax=Coffea arabica TaxID=13443 RepID=A0A6P6TEX9_COFAR|nr:putative late blight resistance protein homolog R1A-3 [Coffea arabica]